MTFWTRRPPDEVSAPVSSCKDEDLLRVVPMRGGSTKQCLALIHGMGMRLDGWEPLVAALRGGPRIYGLSIPWSGQQSYAWALKCRPATWIARGLKGISSCPSVLVGHSFGANAVLEYLEGQKNAGVRALVLISPFYKPQYEDFDWNLFTYYVVDFHKLLEEGLRVMQPNRGRSADVLTAMAEKVRDRIGPYGWMQFFTMFCQTPALDLAAVTVPCLILAGERDVAAFPEDCQALARGLPCAEMQVLEGCGHFCMVEDPMRVACYIDTFLERYGIRNRGGKV